MQRLSPLHLSYAKEQTGLQLQAPPPKFLSRYQVTLVRKYRRNLSQTLKSKMMVNCENRKSTHVPNKITDKLQWHETSSYTFSSPATMTRNVSYEKCVDASLYEELLSKAAEISQYDWVSADGRKVWQFASLPLRCFKNVDCKMFFMNIKMHSESF